MDEDTIIQKMELDASQTLAALSETSAAFDAFSTKLQSSMSRLAGNFNEASDKIIASLKQIGSATGANAGAQFEQMGTKARAASKDVAALQREAAKLTEKFRTPAEKQTAQFDRLNTLLQQQKISRETYERAWADTEKGRGGVFGNSNYFLTPETLLRVVQTQALVRGLNEVRDAFYASAEAALKFSKQVGEIRAIDSSRSFGRIAADIREMSDKFNQPLSDVAEGVYQTISNQFSQPAEQAKILSASNTLAKTTAQDLGTAVELVTGSLNAYGESADKADLRAAQFFTTIQMGHLRMNDLATAMGRTQAIGHELGVSQEELQAGLVAITIGGVKASEAATQLRGVMAALLKPSQALKEAFHRIGVDSGEAAVATWGLLGTLQQLEKITHGEPSKVATLFPNIRGLAGELRISGAGMEKYQRVMEAQRAIDATTMSKKLEEFTSTDAEKLTREVNKIKNFFATEFGPEIIKSLRLVSGGTDTLIGSLRILGNDALPIVAVALGVGAVALVRYKFQAEEAAAAAKAVGLSATESAARVGAFKTLWNNPMGAFQGAMIGVGLGEMAKMTGEGVGNWAFEKFFNEQGKVREALAAQLEARKKQADAEIRLEEDKNARIVQQLLQHVTEKNKILLQHQDDVRASMKIEEQVTKIALDRIMEERKRMTQELGTISVNASKKAEEEIPRTIRELKERREDRKFDEWEAKKPSIERFLDEQIRTRNLIDEAEKLQAGAKDQNQEKLAQDAWKRAEAYQKKAQQAAKTPTELKDAAELEDRIDRTKIEALEKQKTLQAALSVEAEARQQTAERHSLELEERRRMIEEKLKPTIEGEKGVQFKDAAAWARDSADAQQMIDALMAKMKSYNGEDFEKAFLGDQKAFDALRRESEKSLASGYVQQLRLAPKAMDDFQADLQGQADKMRVEVPVIARWEKLTGVDIGTQGVARWAEAVNDLQAKEIERRTRLAGSEKDKNALLGTFNSARDDLERRSSQTNAAAWLGYRGSPELVANSREFQGYLHQAVLMMGQQHVSAGELENMKTLLSPGNIEAVVPPGQRTQAIQDAATILDMLGRMKTLKDEMPEAKPLVSPDDTKAVEEQVESFGMLKVSLDAVIESYSRLAVLQGGQMQTACTGGFLYRASGGEARGTDTIPAMLSPGEMVINAESSRRFASQLIALNAGIQPAYRNMGGNVTNVGDISVTVNGGDTGRQTAREIAVGLRRELRRGNHVF